MLPGEIDVEGYIRELEITLGKLTGENEALRNENESLKKKLLLYENPHTPPSGQMIRPKITDPHRLRSHKRTGESSEGEVKERRH